VPFKKTAKTVIGYLEKAEMDALLNQPDRCTSLGARDHALLLFLYNSGARADEAAKLTVGNLQLGASPSVRLHGKGNKFRTCPLWPTTATSLSSLVAERDKTDSVFLSRVNQSLTRFGIHRVVTQYASLASRAVPTLATKRVSPHTIRHDAYFVTQGMGRWSRVSVANTASASSLGASQSTNSSSPGVALLMKSVERPECGGGRS
jgi:site-specific recombinase XerD